MTDKDMEELIKSFKKLGSDEGAQIGEGMGELSDTIASGAFNSAMDKLENQSSLTFPLSSFFQQIISQINAETAQQSAETMIAFLNLLKLESTQTIIQGFANMLIWILEQIEKIANFITRISEAGEDKPPDYYTTPPGEITDPNHRPWWWLPWVPWPGPTDPPDYVPPGDGTQ